jgi:hypothetical protein
MILTNFVILLVLYISDVPSELVVWNALSNNDVLFVLDTDVLSSHISDSVSFILEHLPPSVSCVVDLHVG